MNNKTINNGSDLYNQVDRPGVLVDVHDNGLVNAIVSANRIISEDPGAKIYILTTNNTTNNNNDNSYDLNKKDRFFGLIRFIGLLILLSLFLVLSSGVDMDAKRQMLLNILHDISYVIP